MMSTNNTISSDDFYDTTAVLFSFFACIASSIIDQREEDVKPTVPTHMKYLASHTFVVAHHSHPSHHPRTLRLILQNLGITSLSLFVITLYTVYTIYIVSLSLPLSLFVLSLGLLLSPLSKKKLHNKFSNNVDGKIKKMLRSTASLLSRSGVARRVVRSSSSAFMSSSSSVPTTRQVSAMQNSFVRSMNSASTIIEDDGSDYGFGESIPEQEIPEEFIEEGEETIVSHSKYILITVYRLLFAQT